MERVHRFDRRQERCDRIAPTLLASGVGAERACAWPLGRLLPTPRGRTEPTRVERDDEEWGQLATKIPKELQQRAQTALRENRRVDTGLRDAGASGEARLRRAARSRARVEPAASDARDAGTEKQGCATKVCRACKRRKPLTAFGRRAASLDSWCRACWASYFRRWRAANRDHCKRQRAYYREHLEHLRAYNCEYQRRRRAVMRARKRKVKRGRSP